jgi:hypothetical protein
VSSEQIRSLLLTAHPRQTSKALPPVELSAVHSKTGRFTVRAFCRHSTLYGCRSVF